MSNKETPENEKRKELTRRDFLKDAGLVVGGAVLGSSGLAAGCKAQTTTQSITTTVTSPPVTTTVTSPPVTTTVKANYKASQYMVTCDTSLCTMCSSCAAVCCMMRVTGESNTQLGAIQVSFDHMNGEVKYVNTCRQCAAPSCMQACLVGAIYIDEKTGARVIDQTKCIGCKSCQIACPFGAVVYNPKTSKCYKCDLCGGDPLCVKHCPSGATSLVSPTEGGK